MFSEFTNPDLSLVLRKECCPPIGPAQLGILKKKAFIKQPFLPKIPNCMHYTQLTAGPILVVATDDTFSEPLCSQSDKTVARCWDPRIPAQAGVASHRLSYTKQHRILPFTRRISK